jgi:outer membrane immunogenic protein
MRHVTRLCIGVTAAMTLSVAAQAADLRPPVSKAPAMTWTGWYIGASAGYGWSNSHVDPRATTALCNDTNIGSAFCTPFPALGLGPNLLSGAQSAAVPASLLTHPSGGMLGAHLGYDYQVGSIVYGAETDISWTNINGSNTQSGSAQVFPTNFLFGFAAINAQAVAEQRFRYFGTARGRLGYLPAESLLLFVTGGLAYAQVSSSLTVGEGLTSVLPAVCFLGAAGCGPITPALGSISQTRVGWTAGFGAEFILPQQQHWSFKAEYLYFNLGSASYQSALTMADTNGVPATAVAVNTNVDFSGSIFRAGFNYRFD